MQTLLIQYQIGTCAPSWYPLYGDVTLSEETIAEQLATCRASPAGAFRNILQHRVVDDGLSESEFEARELAAERSERNHCDPAYIHDVRFGDQ